MLMRECICGRRLKQGERCPSCERTWHRRALANYDRSLTAFYAGAAWRTLSELVKARAAGLDELSRAEGFLEQGRIAHHIEPLKAKPELGLELENVIFLSERNHHRVHAEYRKGGMAEAAMKAALRNALHGMGG